MTDFNIVDGYLLLNKPADNLFYHFFAKKRDSAFSVDLICFTWYLIFNNLLCLYIKCVRNVYTICAGKTRHLLYCSRGIILFILQIINHLWKVSRSLKLQYINQYKNIFKEKVFCVNSEKFISVCKLRQHKVSHTGHMTFDKYMLIALLIYMDK